METDEQIKNIKSEVKIKWYQIALPIAIGLAVVFAMFYGDISEMKANSFPALSWGLVCGLLLGLVCVIGRDYGMMWRFRIVTNGDLTWYQALKVCLLCEFTSAITPSAVGGSALGMVFLNSEGINLGRSTTLMFITIFLDELFFVVSCPIILLLTSYTELFSTISKSFTTSINIIFWCIYGVIALWTAILFIGLVWKPLYLNIVLRRIFSLRFLKRWEIKAYGLAENMLAASIEVRKHKFMWWLKVFAATCLSWISRYLIVCSLFLAFVPHADQWIVFARQCVVWLVLMVCPTPGGSGVSEWLFKEYYSDMINLPFLALVIALVWRIMSYYIYLFIGALVVPSWLRKIRNKRK